MTVLWMVVIGFVVGFLARAIMPGRDPAGVLMTAVLGIVGSFVAGFLGQGLGLYQVGQPAGFLASVVGAVLVLFIYRQAVRKKA